MMLAGFINSDGTMMRAETFKDPAFLMTLLITPLSMIGMNLVAVTVPEILSFYNILPVLSGGLPNPVYGTAAGLITSAFVASAVIVTPLVGFVVDRVGQRLVVLFSFIGSIVFGILVYVAPTFEIFLWVRVLQGITAAALFPIGDIIIGDRFSGPELNRAMGYNQSTFALGNVIFPLLGGVLGEVDWRLNFLVPLVYVPLAIFAWKFLPKGSSVSEGLDPPEVSPLRRLREFGEPTILLVLLSGVALPFVIMTAQGTYLPILLGAMGISPALRGLTTSCMWIVTAIISWGIHRIVHPSKVAPYVAVGFGIFGVIFVLYPMAPSFEIILLLSAVMGVGMGILRPPLQTLTIQVAPKGLKATLVSFRATAMRLGQTVGPLAYGFIYPLTGLIGMFYTLALSTWVNSAMVVLSIILAPIYYRTRVRPGKSTQ